LAICFCLLLGERICVKIIKFVRAVEAQQRGSRVVTVPISRCTPPHRGSDTAAEKIIIERLKYKSLTCLAP
jgi:hypothetical protein